MVLSIIQDLFMEVTGSPDEHVQFFFCHRLTNGVHPTRFECEVNVNVEHTSPSY